MDSLFWGVYFLLSLLTFYVVMYDFRATVDTLSVETQMTPRRIAIYYTIVAIVLALLWLVAWPLAIIRALIRVKEKK